MPQTYTNLIYHVVFSTKDREPFLTDDLRPDVCNYIGGIIKHERGCLLAAGGIEDHLHLLFTGHPAKALSDTMSKVKSNASRWLRAERAMTTFAWQDGFGAFSVSQSAVEDVRRYIDNQREHHRNASFLDELKALYAKNGIDYDPQWIA